MTGDFTTEVSFRRAAAAGDLSTVQRLVDNDNINVDCAGKNGATALHKAAEHGRASVIRFLGRKNASINLTGGIFGGTPLQHAVYWGQTRAVQQLLKLGADPFLADQNGDNALDIARSRTHENIQFLLENWTSSGVISRTRSLNDTKSSITSDTAEDITETEFVPPDPVKPLEPVVKNQTPDRFGEIEKTENAKNEKLDDNRGSLKENGESLTLILPGVHEMNTVMNSYNSTNEPKDNDLTITENYTPLNVQEPSRYTYQNIKKSKNNIDAVQKKQKIIDFIDEPTESAEKMRSVEVIRKSSISSLNSDESEKVFEQIVKKSTKPEKPKYKPNVKENLAKNVEKNLEKNVETNVDTQPKQILLPKYQKPKSELSKPDSKFYSIEERIRQFKSSSQNEDAKASTIASGVSVASLINRFSAPKMENKSPMSKVKVHFVQDEKVVQSDDSGAAPSEMSDQIVPDSLTHDRSCDQKYDQNNSSQVSDYETLTEDSSHIPSDTPEGGNDIGNEPEVGTATGKEPDLEKSEFDETLVSPTEEALEDLLSIIPQLHTGTGELRSITFDESQRHKWDYVAEIFVDLQDLHSHVEIPNIIDSINSLKDGRKIGPLLQEITNVVAQIQDERIANYSPSKAHTRPKANVIRACI